MDDPDVVWVGGAGSAGVRAGYGVARTQKPSHVLLEAASERRVAVVRNLLDRSPALCVDGDAADGVFTPLHVAVSTMEAGRPDIVALLLERGANPDGREPAPAQTPLELALASGKADAAELLLEHGAAVDRPNRRGEPPLLAAARLQQPRAVMALLRAGAPVEGAVLHRLAASDDMGDALCFAIAKQGADPCLCDARGRTPLHVAADLGNRAACEGILGGLRARGHRTATKILDQSRRRPDQLAAIAGHPELAILLKTWSPSPAATAVNRAIFRRGSIVPRLWLLLMLFFHIAGGVAIDLAADPVATAIVLALALGTLIAFATVRYSDPGWVDESTAPLDGPLCKTCLLPRPARSKHDLLGGRCVLRFDHRCLVIDSAIGLGNQRAFFVFCWLQTATILHGIFLLARHGSWASLALAAGLIPLAIFAGSLAVSFTSNNVLRDRTAAECASGCGRSQPALGNVGRFCKGGGW